jgi:lipopolysaccharide/colanic/teichoic acid biosynthesis glycosyltransferase
VLLISWFITAWLTHKYKPQYYQRKWKYVIAPFVKAIFFHLFFIFVLGSVFLESFYENGILFKSSILYLIPEFFLYSIVILLDGFKKNKVKGLDLQMNKYLQDDLKSELQAPLFFSFSEIRDGLTLFTEKIIFQLYASEQLAERANTSDIKIITSGKDLNGEDRQYPVCLLDVRINDLKDINKSFASIYHLMIPGAYLFAVYKDLDDFEQEYLSSKKGFIRFLKTGYYYLYHRAFPKIPWLKGLYKIISGGRNKVISRAETRGRLFYCGFEVEKEIRNEGLCYLLTRKFKTPSENPAPSFYPVITLNRVSLYGNIIKIHKIRSMYPYSEFIQKKVFDEANLTSTGKFGNDFRITKAGKIFRKYWIDEIPQFLDWFRGKIKLVGIRAMSQHYFSLYPQEYKDLYYQVKPGIISPIFDEATDGFSEIVRIEQIYLENYLKNPMKTDFKYFFITLKHMCKGVRSK